jgi:hypothetical protein
MAGRVSGIHYRTTHNSELCRYWGLRLVSLCQYITTLEKAIISTVILRWSSESCNESYGGLLAVRNRRVSILIWGPRRNWAVPAGVLATALIGVRNLYGPGLQNVDLDQSCPCRRVSIHPACRVTSTLQRSSISFLWLLEKVFCPSASSLRDGHQPAAVFVYLST